MSATDPLTDVLSLLGARSTLSSTFAAGGSWRVAFEPPDGLKFNAVRRGTAVLTVEGEAPVTVRAGDSYLLSGNRAFTLASPDHADPHEAVPARDVFAAAVDGVARVGTGEDLLAIGGSFHFSGGGRLLLDSLPALLLVPGTAPEAAAVTEVLASIAEELALGRVGATVVAEHLGVVMLIAVLRWHLRHDGVRAGWLAGLGDPLVAQALAALHGDPAHRWTVAELARVCHVSRSGLARRFRDHVGTGPMDYLLQWRMELATHRLSQPGAAVATVARQVGYGSESSFSAAYKRVTGVPPSRAGRARRDLPSPSSPWEG